MTTASSEARAKRPYRSARRTQQAADTRATVLAAATSLFASQGWSATDMRDVAAEAGVAVETVYASFGSKPSLLLAAIDSSVVGDSTPAPLSERPEFAALGVGDFDERLGAAVRLVSEINQRSWGLRRALYEAAGSEPQLAAKVHELERSRRNNLRAGGAMVMGGSLDEEVLDGLWAVTGAEVFTLLTGVGGRTIDDYERWLRSTLRRLLGRDEP